MRNLTPAERTIVHQIYAAAQPTQPTQPKRKLRTFFTGNNTPPAEINSALFSQLESPGAIAALAPFVAHPDITISTMALEQMARILDGHDSLNLHWLDQSIRSVYYDPDCKSWLENWFQATVSTVDNLPFEGRLLVTALTLFCCHNNGYVRMQALERLASVDMETAIRVSFVRANDWVSQVSQIAFDVTAVNLPRLQESQLIQYLHLVDQLTNKTRRDLSAIQRAVKDRLDSDKGHEALATAVKNADYKLARLAFKVLTEFSYDPGALLQISTASKDVVIRGKSFNLIHRLESPQSQYALLETLAADRQPLICKRALYAVVEAFPNDAEPLLLANLLHQSKGIRNTCKYYLQRLSAVNFADFYINHLQSDNPRKLVSAILGLSEVGNAGDWAHVSHFESSNDPRVRSAVVRAAGNLGCMPPAWFEDKMIAGSESEARIASEILAADENYSAQDLVSLLWRSNETGRLRRIVKIARKKSKWDYLVILLNVHLKNPESDLPESALREWFELHYQSYWFVKPNQEILHNLISLIDKAKTVKSIKILDAIEKYVSSLNASRL
ncbi:HEAT repeat domain-containing protein [Hahella sp. NBU794]|uniref:HEAT repeat domain-containing protein n=1 Tax=Hahella sp. NBU794 TaxID=3422590 RepID=UPI003D6F3907